MELIEKVAIALAHDCGLDFNEVCGVDADPDEGYCDSGTCVASGYEDHDADYARAIFRSQAKAAIRAMLDGVEPYAWHCVSKKYPDLDSLVMDAANSPSPEFNETPLYSLDALKEAL